MGSFYRQLYGRAACLQADGLYGFMVSGGLRAARPTEDYRNKYSASVSKAVF